MLKFAFLTILVILGISLSSYGQGFFVSEYYSTEDYNSHQQNWVSDVDSNQFISFGNGNGLLTFTGKEWQFIHIGETGRSNSVFKSEDGKVFASGQYDYGNLSIDSLNRRIYTSISDEIYPADATVNFHKSTFQLGSDIYFFGLLGFDVLTQDGLKHYPVDNVFHPIAFELNNRIYVSTLDGIFEFINGRYYYLDNSSFLEEDKVTFQIKTQNNEILLGYLENGLVFFDGERFRRFETEIDAFLKEKYLYSGIQINDTLFAIGTVYDGVAFINHKGELKRLYNKDSGAPENGYFHLSLDHENTLWMSMWTGINRLHTNIPIYKYSELDGIENEIINIELKGNSVWIETLSGVYMSQLMPSGESKFYSYKTGSKLFKSGEEIVSIDEDGINLLQEEGEEIRIVDGSFKFLIQNHDQTKSSFFYDGQAIFEKKGSKLIQLPIEVPNADFKSGLMKDRTIFLLSSDNKVYVQKENHFEVGHIERSSSARIIINQLGVIDNRIALGIEGKDNSGFYFFNPDSIIFKKPSYWSAFDSELIEQQVFSFKQCSNGDLWVSNNKKIKRVIFEGDSLNVQVSPYQIIDDVVYTIECHGEEVWFGGVNGLYQLKEPDWNYKTDFKTNITGIYVNNDSLIYGGFGEPVNDLILPYEDNELRFTYAAASYIDETRNTYSVKLEGFDNTWSDWSLETQKDYTNIPEGEYIFKVRSKNVYEVDGREDAIMFSVLPPWYRTWWAYFFYVIFVTGVLYTAYKIRVNQLLKVERMRTRIASDLHDEVSATLTGISYFAEAVRLDKDKSKKDHFISLITESASDAKEKITDIVWSINPDNDDWGLFLAKCKRYASDLLESKDIKYDLNIAEQVPGRLPMEIRQNLWMIFKEILTNSVRHSNSSQINVIMDVDGNYLKLIVQDDGKGFESGEENPGNGIANIKRRAVAINATAKVDSESGFGTRWRIVLPLS